MNKSKAENAVREWLKGEGLPNVHDGAVTALVERVAEALGLSDTGKIVGENGPAPVGQRPDPPPAPPPPPENEKTTQGPVGPAKAKK